MKKAALCLAALFLCASLGAGAALADCPDTRVQCWGEHPDTGEYSIPCGEITVGACWSGKDIVCWPCATVAGGGMCDYKDDCARAFPSCCQDQSCHVLWHKKGWNKAWCGEGHWNN
jgi:hypothetical protein